MIFDWAANGVVGGFAGVFPMNLGGGGAGEDPSPGGGGDDVGLGGPELSIETGLVAGAGLSPTSGLTKRTI